jgi:pimeloyl-ACP methyl ester carboxylesterase
MMIIAYRSTLSTYWLLLLVVRECSCNKNNNKNSNTDRRLRLGERIPSFRGLLRRRSPSLLSSSSSSSSNSLRKTERRGFWNKRRTRHDPGPQQQQEDGEEEEDQLEKQQQQEEVTQVPGNMLPHGIFRGVRDRLFRGSTENGSSSNRQNDDNANSQLIPLVYRYYGRNRARTHTAGGSIPFLILGPNVDHWKVISQQLAAKGFSVMACERVKEDDSTPTSLQCTLSPTTSTSAARATRTLVTLLDALRWKRVVLVACDSESALAVRAALELAPERIVGLVLCGSLQPVEPLIQEYSSRDSSMSTSNGSSSGAAYFLGSTPPSPLVSNTFHVDRFLQRNLKCPFAIVWGGDNSPVTDDDEALLPPPSLPIPSNSDFCGIHDAVAAARRTILGAGSAPHRRRPEMMTWVLTRFVEEEIATGPSLLPLPIVQRQQQQQVVQQQRTILSSRNITSLTIVPSSPRHLGGLKLPFELQEFFSSQAFVVFGRIMATALFYATAMRVGYYQYDNFSQGIRQVSAQLRKSILTPSKWGRRILGALHIGGILSSLRDKGIVPILSCLKRVTCGVLFFHKNDSQVKEANDDSEAESQSVQETEPPPNKKEGEQTDSKKEDSSDKDNDRGTRKHGSSLLEEEEETKPRSKPFFLLDRVIA